MKMSIIRTTMKFRILPLSVTLLLPILMLCTPRTGEARTRWEGILVLWFPW